MLIPWGHDSSQLRRRPWVTYGLSVACLLAFVASLKLEDPAWARADAQIEEAFGYWQDHPYLEGNERLVRSYWALDEEDLAYWATETGGFIPGEDVIAREQAQLEKLTAEARASLDSHPWYRFGLVPAAPSLAGLFGHMFLHMGWLHLIGNLWFLILTGPYIEDRFGRGLFLVFYLASGFAGAALFASTQGAFDFPLIGASGAVSGILGAFLVCCLHTRIKFFYWVIWPGTFAAPAWVMLPLWFGNEVLSAVMTGGASAVAYWAHVGGFAFGAVAALAIRALGIDTRLARDLGQLDAASGSPLLDATRSAIQEGRFEDAIAGADAALADGNATPDAVDAYLEALHAVNREADAAPKLVEHLFAAIEWRKKDAALALWDGIAKQKVVPTGRGEPMLQLAGWLRGAGKAGEASIAMRQALEAADGPLALRVARAARRHDPVLVKRAAEQALASIGVNEADRKAMQALLTEAGQEATRRGFVLVADGERVEKRAIATREPEVPEIQQTRHDEALPIEPVVDYETEILGEPEPVGRDPFADVAEDALGLDAAEMTVTAHGTREPVGEPRSEAIDISHVLCDATPPPVELPDPETAGEEAFLDSLHASLESDAFTETRLVEREEWQGGEVTDEPAQPDFGPLDATLFGEPGGGLADSPSTEPPDAQAETRLLGVEAAAPLALRGPGAGPLEEAAVPDDDFFALDEEKEEAALPPRTLRVLSAVPLALDSTHLSLDVEGRGRSRLALERIDAVSTAGVKGLSSTGKPVLVIDLCLNWTGHDDLQVVRLRSDSFDPRKLVESAGSPLKALRALAALLVKRCRGAALPVDATPEAPFKIFPDAARYEHEVLGAVR